MSDDKFGRANDNVPVACGGQRIIPSPAVCSNQTPVSDMRSDKADQALRRSVRNMLKTDSTHSLSRRSSFVLNGDHHQSFVFSATAAFTRTLASNVRFIHFDGSTKTIASGSNHSPPQPVQPFPRRMIATKTKNSLQA